MNSSQSSSESDSSGSPPKKRNKLLPPPPTPRNREFRQIPIFIVEYHNEVLNFIYKCFTSRHLPVDGNTLVHFDSHPDMVVPRDINTSSMYTKEYLEDLSIEDWIIPGCYMGHFKKVIWIKNSWCNQIPTGTHEFSVGQVDGNIAVSLATDYFISEGSYIKEEWFEDAKEITLQVIDADREIGKIEVDSSESVILDIDLDFFSTADPFPGLYEKADCYNKLKKIFDYRKDSGDEEEISDERQKQLSNLNDIFDDLQRKRRLDFPDDDLKIPHKTFDEIKTLIHALHENYSDEEIDYNLIYNAGCTCDHGGLPNHISTDEELEKYLKNFEEFLQRLSGPPKIVTMSRSSEDGYCPKDQVDRIQKRVIEILKNVYGDKVTSEPIIALNGETNWNLMQL